MKILDFDDFCEGNEQMAILKSLKNSLPGFKVNLFTIPGRCSNKWIEEMKKIEWIDMIPHGFLHPNPRECQTWEYQECKNYLKYLEQFGLTKGFKAPGWQISDGMYRALLEEGYWVADQSYNDERRPKELKAYILDSGDKIHGHIGHLGGHNANEIEYLFEHILEISDEFAFIKDIMDVA